MIFWGNTFRPRLSRNRRGKFFENFTPAISNKAAKAIRQKVRSWNWQLRPGDKLEDLAIECNPIIQGWINYYGRYNPSYPYWANFQSTSRGSSNRLRPCNTSSKRFFERVPIFSIKSVLFTV
ncbi:group II intron maturase-specific domain-containing protein [Desulfobacter vibrioformis]|uniref:group II intron maturase-specific domain-containing protein n=1 Tax=Desulfobacter vibrioformis TaxID=34031 RepID=UPI001FE21DBD|nr:group II intron maturase-specific domain-containing protein [Desulfobacter vibrioformis]